MKSGLCWLMVTRESLGRLSFVQNDEIEGFDSTVVCLMTSFTSDDMTTRVKVPPTTQNGLIKKLGDDGEDSCSAHFGIGPTHWNFGR